MIDLRSLIMGSWQSEEAETRRFIQSLESGKMQHAGRMSRRLGRRARAESVLKAARASLERNHPELALALAESGITRFPADAEFNYVCGRIWHFRGAWDRALEHYARATDQNAAHARAWIDKGCVLHALGRSAE